MIDNKVGIFEAVRKILQPGGVFAFNTTFFEGSVPHATRRFYVMWMLKARQLLKSEHIEAVLASVGGNKTRASEILGISRKSLRERLKTPDRGPAE